MTYCTLADIKDYLGITSATDDALLERMLDAATAYIESASGAGRQWNTTVTSRTFRPDAFEGGRLWIDDDLARIDSIVIGTGDPLTTDQYRTAPDRAPYLAVDITAPIWGQGVTITGVWAYGVTPPADIVHACRRLAAWWYRQKDTSGDMSTAIVTADGTTILPTSIPKDVASILAGYRRYV